MLFSLTAPLLKPKTGVFAVFGYQAVFHCAGYTQFQSAFREFYHDTLGSMYAPESERCYWDIHASVVDSHFGDELRSGLFGPPFDASTISSASYYEKKRFTESELFGFIQSWSAYHNYCRAHGIETTFHHNPNENNRAMDDRDPLKRLQECFRQELADKKEESMQVFMPFFLITMRK